MSFNIIQKNIEEKTNNTIKYYIINYKKQKKNLTISLILFGGHSLELITSELGIYRKFILNRK